MAKHPPMETLDEILKQDFDGFYPINKTFPEGRGQPSENLQHVRLAKIE